MANAKFLGAVALVVLVAFPQFTNAQSANSAVTFTKDIAPIFQEKCQACHRADSMAPMSLVTYEEARPWAKAIRDEVLNRRMPPWGPVKGIGHFRNDPSLSFPEIDMFVAWVEGGAGGVSGRGGNIFFPPCSFSRNQLKLRQETSGAMRGSV